MKAALTLVLVLLLPNLAVAATQLPTPQTWSIDAARSQAQLSVRRLWFAHETGPFPELRGTLRRIDSDLVEVDSTLMSPGCGWAIQAIAPPRRPPISSPPNTIRGSVSTPIRSR